MNLSSISYTPDPGLIEYTNNGNIVLYHYTYEDRLDQIFAENGGLLARLKVDNNPEPPEEFVGCYKVETFLEPLPKYFTSCPYFGNFGLEMVRKFIGNYLLRIELPTNYINVYIADYAHIFECKHQSIKGETRLNLGYNCNNGKEATQAFINSFIEFSQYGGVHIAPAAQLIQKGKGIIIPNEFISISSVQPFL